MLNLILNRRSIRKYKNEIIKDEELEKILLAGLLTPSGRNKKPTKLILIKDKNKLKQLSNSREFGADMLKEAAAAIVVVADGVLSDTWIEDSSLAMSHMHLMATDLNIGSCWIQIRNRTSIEGKMSEDFVKEVLDITDDNIKVLSILSLGYPKENIDSNNLDKIDKKRVFFETFKEV